MPEPAKKRDVRNAKLSRLWRQGVLVRDIADQLDISEATVKKVRSDLGLPARQIRGARRIKTRKLQVYVRPHVDKKIRSAARKQGLKPGTFLSKKLEELFP